MLDEQIPSDPAKAMQAFAYFIGKDTRDGIDSLMHPVQEELASHTHDGAAGTDGEEAGGGGNATGYLSLIHI